MANALFIGRFQPFHLGHLSVVKQALKENDFLNIGIGSAEDSFQKENPFTASERMQMIKSCLDSENIDPNKYCLIPIRNINNYNLWCRHVKMLTFPFKKVYTGSPLIKLLFEQEKDVQVIQAFIKIDICASKIRKKILKEENWEKHLHPNVIEKIKDLNGVERIKIINQSL